LVPNSNASLSLTNTVVISFPGASVTVATVRPKSGILVSIPVPGTFFFPRLMFRRYCSDNQITFYRSAPMKRIAMSVLVLLMTASLFAREVDMFAVQEDGFLGIKFGTTLAQARKQLDQRGYTYRVEEGEGLMYIGFDNGSGFGLAFYKNKFVGLGMERAYKLTSSHLNYALEQFQHAFGSTKKQTLEGDNIVFGWRTARLDAVLVLPVNYNHPLMGWDRDDIGILIFTRELLDSIEGGYSLYQEYFGD
jgi:hypothetical protein